MVFETVFANLLNTYLSDFIDDLSASQLKLGAFKGNIELTNLAIKENAFDKLNLPIRIIHGHVGKLIMKIPWMSLYTSPVIISLQDIFALAVPNVESRYDPEYEAAQAEAAKQKQLQNIEESIKKQALKSITEGNQQQVQDDFVTKAVAQVIKNIQITVENVHIRYEDKFTYPKIPFSVGLTLSQLVFQTPEKQTEKKNDPNVPESRIFKITHLRYLSVYWNCGAREEFMCDMDASVRDDILSHAITKENRVVSYLNYILEPINFSANAEIHRKPQENSFKTPLFSIEIVLDQLCFSFKRVQFESLVMFLDSLNRMSVASTYRQWRPAVPLRGHAKEWWKFAITAITEGEIKRKVKAWEWTAIKNHRNHVRRYMKLYKKRLLKATLTKEEEQQIKSLEKELDVFNIVLARNEADLQASAQRKEEESKKPKEPEKKGWFAWVWGENTKEKEAKEQQKFIEQFKNEMTPAEKIKFYQAIGYEETAQPVDYPPEFVAHLACVRLKVIKFTVLDEIQNEKIVQLTFEETNARIDHRPASNGITVGSSIKSLLLTGAGGIVLADEESEDKNLLSVKVDVNPVDKRYDFGIELFTTGVKFMYDAATINTLVEIISPPSDASLDQIQSLAAIKLKQLKHTSVTGLEFAIEKHKQIHVKIGIEPSFVIVPDNGNLETCRNILVLCLGKLTANSTLINKKELSLLQKDETKLKAMRDKAYEKYVLSIAEVQVILSDSSHWKDDIIIKDSKDSFSSRHLVEPIALSLTVMRSIILDDPAIPKLKVVGDIPKLYLKASDEQICSLAKLATTMPLPNQQPVDSDSVSLGFESTSVAQAKQATEAMIVVDTRKKRQEQEENITQLTELVLTFQVGGLIVDLRNSEYKEVIKLGIQDVGANLEIKTFSMAADFHLKQITMEAYDKDAHRLEIAYTLVDTSHSENLLLMKYEFHNQTSPTFKNVVQKVNITMSQIELNSSYSILVEILAWTQQLTNNLPTSAAAVKPPEGVLPRRRKTSSMSSLPTVGPKTKGKKKGGKGNEVQLDPKSVINLSAHFEIIKFTLNIHGICTAQFSGLNCDLKMLMSERMVFDARWKDFQILNRMLDDGTTSLYTHIIKSEGAHVLELSVVMYSKKEVEEKVSDVDMLIKVHFGRLAVVFLNKFVMELVDFLSLFEAAKAKAIEASSAAADYAKQSAINAYESLTKMGLDVVLEAPNVVVPRNSRSTESLMINLGNVTVKNAITSTKTLVLDSITCNLTDTKIAFAKDGRTTSLDDILMPITFSVKITRNLTFIQNTSEPEVNISGVFQNIQLKVSQGDLKLFMRILNENLGSSASKGTQEVAVKTPAPTAGGRAMRAPPSGIMSSVIVEEAVVHVDAADEEHVQSVVFAKFKFDFTLHGIHIVLYDGAIKTQTYQLCDLQLANLEAFGVIHSNDSVHAGVALANIVFSDIRATKKEGGIKQLMYAKVNANSENSMDGVMLRVSYTQQEDTFIDVHMSGFAFILALDYMLRITNLLTSAMTEEQVVTADSQVNIQQSSDSMKVFQSNASSEIAVKEPPKTSNMLMVVNFRMSQMDVILLESVDTTDCSSVILNSIVEVGLKQQESRINISGKVSNVQLAITNFDRFRNKQEIDAYILKPTEINFHAAIDEAQSQHIDVMMNDIKFHISPNTVQALLSILSGLGTSEAKDTDQTKESTSVNVKTFFLPKKISDPKKYWYLHREVVVGVEATEETAAAAASPFLIKQQLVITVSSLSLTIESGGIDSMPLLKLESSLTGRLDNWKNIDLHCNTSMQYYNVKRFVWEPIIDILEGNHLWSFNMMCNIIENTDHSQMYDVKIESADRLELTVTKTALNVLTSLQQAFSHAVKKTEKVGTEEVVQIYNYLGLDLYLFVPSAKFTCVTEGAAQEKVGGLQTLYVKPGTLVQLKTLTASGERVEYDDLQYRIIVNRSNIDRRVSLRCKDKRCYSLPVDTLPNEEWRYIIDMTKQDFKSKDIIFHSNVEIVNKFQTKLELYTVADEENVSFFGQVEAASNFYVPLSLIYSSSGQVFVKPEDDYCTPKHGLVWRSVTKSKPSYYNIICESKTVQPNFCIRIKQMREDVVFEDTGTTRPDSVCYKFELLPSFKLRNLLPLPVRYSLKGIQNEWSLLPGSENDMSYADLRDTTLIVHVEDYLGEHWMSTKKVPPRWAKEDEVEIWSYTTVETNDPMSVDLAMNYSTADESGIRIASIFSPFWMINKTGLKVLYKVGDTIIEHDSNLNEPVLVCFKPKTLFSKKKLALAFEDSKWSDSFSIDAVGNKGNVIAKAKDKSSYCAAIDITLSSFGLTKIVTVSPFYSIQNKTASNIQVSENNRDWVTVKSKSVQSLWPKSSKDTKLYFKSASDFRESQPISIEKSDSVLLKMGGEVIYVFVEVTDSSVTVQVTNYFKGAAPVRIINATEDLVIDYGQFMVANRGRLAPMSSVYFTWHEPIVNRTIIWSSTDSPELMLELDQDAIGEAKSEALYWVSFLDAKQRILLITRDPEIAQNALHAGEMTKPLYEAEVRLRGIGVSLVDNDLGREILYIGIVSSGIIWEVAKGENKRFKALSVKQSELLEQAFQRETLRNQVSDELMVKGSASRLKELALASNFKVDLTDLSNPKLLVPSKGILRRSSSEGLWCMLSMSEHVVQLHLKVNRIQMDNQMDNCIFGIIMCPVTPPKSISQDRAPKPFIECSALIQRQANMQRFKYFSILIQEFIIQIDGDFLMAIGQFFSETKRLPETNYEKLIEQDLKTIFANPIADEVALSIKNYYDLLHFSPIKVHVSFALGDVGSFDILGGFDFLFKSAGVTLTEFKDVVLRIDYFEKKNALLSDQELIGLATSHYIRQVLKQFYMVVLGLDVIGNPVGLFLGLKQGVGDFFYEPVAGLIEGPEEFAEGLTLGVKSLFSHTVGGAAGALGKITGTLGEGISSLAMDDADKRRRRANLNKRPSLAQSGKNIAKGFLSGVTGIITKPVQGARADGVEGFVKGVRHGVLGVVAQPATGVIDFASGSLNALQRAVDINQEAKKQRPARYIGKDGIVRSYSLHDATGIFLFNELNKGHTFDNDTYLGHCNLSGHMAALLTNHHVYYLKHTSASKGVDLYWYETFENIKQIEICEGVTVRLSLKEQTRKLGGLLSGNTVRIVHCPSAEIAGWLAERIAEKTQSTG